MLNTPASVASVPPRRPFQKLLAVALIGAVASGALGLATILFRLPLRLSTAFGIFFVCFALLKITLVLDALAERRAPVVAGEISRTQAFGSPMLFRWWIAYKVVAALLALAVAGCLFTVGADAIDRLVGGP